MKQVVIENPVINSPFEEPARHFRFSEDGITDELVESRRISAYFVPIASPKKKGAQAQLSFDTESWEQKMASALEEMDEVMCYAKNHNLGFAIPYTINGEERNYHPDFIAQIKSPSRPSSSSARVREPLSSPPPPAGDSTISPSPLAGEGRGEGEINLIIEVTGESKKDKAAKVSTARTLWVPAVNNHGGFGQWFFWEINDPWDAMNTIRSHLQSLKNKDL